MPCPLRFSRSLIKSMLTLTPLGHVACPVTPNYGCMYSEMEELEIVFPDEAPLGLLCQGHGELACVGQADLAQVDLR